MSKKKPVKKPVKKPYPIMERPLEPVPSPPKRPFEWDVREVKAIKSWGLE